MMSKYIESYGKQSFMGNQRNPKEAKGIPRKPYKKSFYALHTFGLLKRT